MNKKQPILTDALYKGHSVPEILNIYENMLKSTGELKDIQHATFINQYRSIILNKKLLSTLRKHFNNLYDLINTNFSDVMFHIDGRRKALLSTESKILKLMDQNRSLDNLRDVMAFRLVIHDDGRTTSIKQSVNQCYLIMEQIIKYGIENEFTLCEANSPEGTDGFDNSLFNLYVPTKSKISEEFKTGVKDYILTPKARNGYQSLHAVFRLHTGQCFEIQVRTSSMDARADENDHYKYKMQKYDFLQIDWSKICIPGFIFKGYDKDGKVNEPYDEAGIEKALSVFHRNKTY